jgi:hypothetical protein
VKFERGGAREQELTYKHVRDFIRTAFVLADKGVIPRERALYMSIGTAAQFELMLRQKDIIGDWSPRSAAQRFPAGITIVHLDDETWTGFFTWKAIPGWRWRTRTSKSKYRAAVEFDLTIYDLLFPLLELVPADQRQGSIVKGEHGLPIRYRSYAKVVAPDRQRRRHPGRRSEHGRARRRSHGGRRGFGRHGFDSGRPHSLEEGNDAPLSETKQKEDRSGGGNSKAVAFQR